MQAGPFSSDFRKKKTREGLRASLVSSLHKFQFHRCTSQRSQKTVICNSAWKRAKYHLTSNVNIVRAWEEHQLTCGGGAFTETAAVSVALIPVPLRIAHTNTGTSRIGSSPKPKRQMAETLLAWRGSFRRVWALSHSLLQL